MFKLAIIASVVLAVANARYGSLSDLDDYENFIDYGRNDNQLHAIQSISYAYQRPRQERVIVEPASTFFEEDDSSRVLIPVPVAPELAVDLGFSKLGLIVKAVTFTFALVKKAVVFVLAKAPGLILGSVVALGICKFTPICSKLTSLKSLVEIPLEIRSYATPERLELASEFVQNAIRKYRSL